mgnify:FL=1
MLHYHQGLNADPWVCAHCAFREHMEKFIVEFRAPTNETDFLTLAEWGHVTLRTENPYFVRIAQAKLESLLEVTNILMPKLFQIDAVWHYRDLKLCSDIFSPLVKGLYQCRDHSLALFTTGGASFYVHEGRYGTERWTHRCTRH